MFTADSEAANKTGYRRDVVLLYMLPLLWFVLITALAIYSYISLEHYEQRNIALTVESQAQAVSYHLQDNLRFHKEALVRMAVRHADPTTRDEAQWRIDAQQYLYDFNSLQALGIVQVGEQGAQVLWQENKGSALKLLDGWQQGKYRILQEPTLYPPLSNTAGHYLLYIGIPINPDHIVLAQYDGYQLIDDAVSMFKTSGYEISASLGELRLCCTPPNQAPQTHWQHTITTPILDHQLSIQVVPLPPTLQQLYRPLKYVPLIFGPLLAISLALALYLFLSYRAKHKQLRGEILHREGAEEELKKLSMAVKYASSSILITNPRGVIEYVNDKFIEVTGYELHEVIGRPVSRFTSGTMPKTFFKNLWQTISRGDTWDGEIQNKTKNGDLYWEHVSISPIVNTENEVTHFVGVRSDISERKAMAEKLQNLAYFDPLTGLPNRTYLKERFSAAMEGTLRHHRNLAILFIDLDNFKVVNDTLGHSAGDQLLAVAAERLSKCVRSDDLVIRQGGDEFVVLLADIRDEMDIEHIAREILTTMKVPIFLQEQEFSISASIGISILNRDGFDLESLCQAADAAMYVAKQQGRNQFSFFDAELNALALKHLTTETELRKAVANKDFTILYQPKVDSTTDQIIGVEALLRWQRNGEMVSPAQFMPLLEETGMIVELGYWILETVFTQLVKWRKQGLIGISYAINLSTKQLQERDFIERITQLMDKCGVDTQLDYIELEVTESALMERMEDAVGILQQLSDANISIAIDDFGTGYSSLAYLKQLPLHTLKIDYSFIKDMHVSGEGLAIVRTIYYLAQALRLQVIAEGVETREQIDLLQLMGGNEVQGYFYAKPLPTETLKELLGNGGTLQPATPKRSRA